MTRLDIIKQLIAHYDDVIELIKDTPQEKRVINEILRMNGVGMETWDCAWEVFGHEFFLLPKDSYKGRYPVNCYLKSTVLELLKLRLEHLEMQLL